MALPRLCVCCDNGIAEGFACDECLQRLRVTEKIYRSTIIDYYFSLYEFIAETEIQDIVHHLKYQHMKSIGNYFGELLGKRIHEEISDRFDLVIPVPLHKTKYAERTYNQSEYIASGIAKITGASASFNLLKRTRYTQSQTKLDISRRKDNVKNAFETSPPAPLHRNGEGRNHLIGKNIILVDDIVTTGSTIMECAEVLKDAGCNKVLACSIARA